MKKVKKLFKNNIKLVLGIIIGLVIAGGSFAVYAAISASSIIYTDNYNLGSTTIQGAIDKLYTKATQESFLPKYKTLSGTPKYYAFGVPTTSSTTNYTSLGKKVFVGLYSDNQYGVCIIRNSKLHCFRYNNWLAENEHVQQVFSDISCYVDSSFVSCFASDFACSFSSDGGVYCGEGGTNEGCNVGGDGSVYCS